MKETDNNELDQRLTAAESRVRLVIDTIPELVWSALPNGSTDFLNRPWREYTGLSVEGRLGWGTAVPVHPEDLPSLADEWRRAIATGQPFEKEARVRRANGEYRWLLFRSVPLRNEQGAIIKWYGTSTDIEDRKQAEQIRLAQARHASVYTDITAVFCQPGSLKMLLSGCVEALVRRLDAAFARIWTLNKDQDTLELQASAGMYTRIDGSHSRVPVGKLKIGLIAEEEDAAFDQRRGERSTGE
jgi:PAS domain S-box-containing protein